MLRISHLTNRARSGPATPLARTLCIGLAAVLLGACGASREQSPVPDERGHRTIAEGYSLLYGIASEQKEMKKLLLVKVESDPVDRMISDIADYTGELCVQLEDMARRYPALTIATQFLPEVEVKARESITSAATKTFLKTSGREFELELLLKQRSALEQEQHIAKVMVDIETAEERRVFWRSVDKRFGELRGDLETLLRSTYFRL